jgi:transcriptional regulator with XRE-family HTH domain
VAKPDQILFHVEIRRPHFGVRVCPAQALADAGQGHKESAGMGTPQGIPCPRPALAVVLLHRASTRLLCAQFMSTSILLPCRCVDKAQGRLHATCPMQYTQLFRRLREQKNLSHEALAKLARCHRNTVLNVESGRQVKFKTIARLMAKMGYPTDSPEMASLALLWLESVSGVDLADPATLGPVRQKLAVYDRTAGQAVRQLMETIRRAKLDERKVRLLTFAALRPEMLAIIGSLQDLLLTTEAGGSELKVAEDR